MALKMVLKVACCLASSLVLSKGLEGGFEDGIRDGWSLVLRMASVAASWMALTMSLLIIDKQARQQRFQRKHLRMTSKIALHLY